MNESFHVDCSDVVIFLIEYFFLVRGWWGVLSGGLCCKVLLNPVCLKVESFEGFDAAGWMTEEMVHVPDKEHPGEEYCDVEFQGSYSVDAEFFQVKEFFQSGEESFDADTFHVFLFEPFWVVWSDACPCCFDDGGDMVFEEHLSDGAWIKCFISDEESSGKSGVIGFDGFVEVGELLRVMNVCRGDGKCCWELCFRVDHRMEFISIDVLLFDVVPAPCCLRVIQVRGDDGTVFDDGGDAEELVGDELLNDLFEQVVESVKSDAFDEVAVVSNVWVVCETKLPSPELVFF